MMFAAMGIFPSAHKKEFELAVVNEPSVFIPLKFYCNLKLLNENYLGDNSAKTETWVKDLFLGTSIDSVFIFVQTFKRTV